MESLVARIFFHNWPRKLVAILAAVVVWLFVNHSINETKVISNIPIKVINLPIDKTIQGLLPNGMLSRRITLTLTGSKDVIEELEPGDIEVQLDASMADNDEWVVQISKKNLVSLNPSIDLLQHISQVAHSDFVIKLSRLMTAKIPVTIHPPRGIPPHGYEYLDVWPQQLTQMVSGPEEEIQQLKENGLELSFDLSDITKADLDAIKSINHNDEISFPVPKKWKQIAIPFRNQAPEDLNDPEAQNLHVDFLRKEFLALNQEIPIRIFYPLNTIDQINPETFSLAFSDDIQRRHATAVFIKPLFAKEVSRLFIDVIRDFIEIVIVAVPKNERKVLAWSVQFINPNTLEDHYIALSISSNAAYKLNQGMVPKNKEELLRKRFRDYMQRLTLYLDNAKKLHLKSTLEENQVRVVAY